MVSVSILAATWRPHHYRGARAKVHYVPFLINSNSNLGFVCWVNLLGDSLLTSCLSTSITVTG